MLLWWQPPRNTIPPASTNAPDAHARCTLRGRMVAERFETSCQKIDPKRNTQAPRETQATENALGEETRPPGIAVGKPPLVVPPKTPLKVVANVTENGAGVPGMTVTFNGFGVQV